MTIAFRTPEDIANRGLQHCGSAPITSLSDDAKSAAAMNFVYDKAREAELRRNIWRFSIRKAPLRPLDTTSLRLLPAVYDPTKTYIPGTLIASDATLDHVYYARKFVPLATAPSQANIAYWEEYFGPLAMQPWNSAISYFAGEVVYTPATKNFQVYVSLASGNTDVPTTVPAYSSTTTYYKGQTVTYLAVVYQSTVDLNLNSTPTGVGDWIAVPATQPVQMMGQKWLRLNASGEGFSINYPVGAGPLSQESTRNVFLLPNGFLRLAPQDPKDGANSILGAPGGTAYNDWVQEGDYIVTRDPSLIVLRFVANVTAVRAMDPMFCEGLGARLALETVESLTQSSEKLTTIAQVYKTFMGEARLVNGIETSPDQPPLDDYIATRV